MIRGALGLVLLGFQVGFSVPMVRGVLCSRSAQGVSLLGEALWVVAGAGWAYYAVVTRSPAVIASGVLAALGSGTVSMACWPYVARRHRNLVAAAAAVAALGGVASTVVTGPPGLAVLLAAFGAVQFLPHLISAVITGVRKVPARGLSLSGTVLRAVYTLGWAWYALGGWAWGPSAGPVLWPLLAWGSVGVVSFATQALVAHRSTRWPAVPPGGRCRRPPSPRRPRTGRRGRKPAPAEDGVPATMLDMAVPEPAPVPGWLPDERAGAGRENLDPDHVARYDAKEDGAAADEIALLQDLGLTNDAVIVDLGAGTGQFTLAAAPHLARVVAVDVSPVMLQALRVKVRSAGLTNVDVVEAGFLTYEHAGPPADVVYSRYALHHLPDVWKAVALARLRGVLRPGGMLRLWDVVYDFPPQDAATRLDAWCATGGTDAEIGWSRAELEEHVRDEHSTFTWLLEPMLQRSGFAIEQAEHSADGIFARYVARAI